MTNEPDRDPMVGKTASLPFESSDLMLAGIRLLPAQLARAIGVSKQAVSTWVKSGRVILGSDGRVDPAQAIDRLLATGNPDRLRIKILVPLQREVSARDSRIADLEVAVAVRDRRIADLEAAVADVQEDADFEAASAAGILNFLDDLKLRLQTDWQDLAALPGMQGPDAVAAWIEGARFDGTDFETRILDHVAVLEMNGTEGAESKSAGEVEE